MCDVTILFFTFRFRNFSEVKMLCEDMLLEILSRLPVRSLKRFMCVSKNFQSIILDARFLRMHLQNSRKRTNIMLSYSNKGKTYVDASPISSLIEDSTPFFTANTINGSKPQRNKYQVLGSCNGLVCMIKWDQNVPDIFYLWNPATATKVLIPNSHPPHSRHLPLKFHENEYMAMVGFGYDNSRDSYKVVAIVGHLNSEGDNHPFRSVIYNLNDNKIGWKDIQDFPVDPTGTEGDGIYLNNTLNWLGSPYCNNYDYDDDRYISFDEVLIASLDLETEMYTQILLPGELNGVSIEDFSFPFDQLHCNEAPIIGVLGGYLSLFLHNHTTKYLIIWQMKEFGNQQSWTLLLNASLQDLGLQTIRFPTKSYHEYYLWRISTLGNQHFSYNYYSNLLPLCMIENDRDIVIIHCAFQGFVKETIVYNLKDKTVTSKKMADNLQWIYPFDYVESLVSPTLE